MSLHRARRLASLAGHLSSLPSASPSSPGAATALTPTRRLRFPVGLTLLLVGLTAGCLTSTQAKDKSASDADLVKKQPQLQCQRTGAERIENDGFRGNNKADVVKVFVKSSEGGARTVLSCREVDLNGDGRKDMLVYFDQSGRKLREEFDHDFDGVTDLRSFYDDGQLVRQELDVNYDGTPDLVEHFENGRRVRVEKLLQLPRPLPPLPGSAGEEQPRAGSAPSSQPAEAAPATAPAPANPASPATTTAPGVPATP